MANTILPILAISAVAYFLIGSVTATPILKAAAAVEGEIYRASTNFVAGKPLTEELLKGDFSNIGKEMTDEFIPWGKQDPTLHEGDIKLYGDKNAILSKSYRWPNAQIPYQISAEYTSDQRKIIAYAMSAYHNNTCIRFVPRTCEKSYITISKTGNGCWSYVGMLGISAQQVSLDDECLTSPRPGVAMHELMHTAGFYHEHTRPDRDTYVKINFTNIQPQYANNFEKNLASQVTTLGLAYDYGSVMHYPQYVFAINKTYPTITPLIGKPALGQRTGFSLLDLQKLNALYCSASK
ncbi:hatching enzyme 1.2-like [Daphnia pulex]|uniref:hatching enzyme 1.2-like n=1 Tax=Daphnia pulex TaxID=6669 RepID=UPI001EDE3754|nr:hatching enzyme 1.2-like [Daphnia pulex]